ncbi:MAG: phenylacetic acid degradation operon negative regulatory protein PaaX, partial [Pseudomonadota bacterium]
MSLCKSTNSLLDAFREQRPLRGGSLIITVFGDAISQHGNSVWLGSIIQALEPFGLNSRLIRTAV